MVHHNLADNFTTSGAIKELLDIVSKTSIYMGPDNTEIKGTLIRDIAQYVLHILSVMGFVRTNDFAYDLGEGGDTEQLISPIMDILRDFRKEI